VHCIANKKKKEGQKGKKKKSQQKQEKITNSKSVSDKYIE
jgi:hypothetical protein